MVTVLSHKVQGSLVMQQQQCNQKAIVLLSIRKYPIQAQIINEEINNGKFGGILHWTEQERAAGHHISITKGWGSQAQVPLGVISQKYTTYDILVKKQTMNEAELNLNLVNSFE